MKIEKRTIYHLPTEELKKDFLTKCQEQGIKWCNDKAAFDQRMTDYGAEHCIMIRRDGMMEYARKGFYESRIPYKSLPLILWEMNKPKPTVIKLPNGHKIVFNAPYTIYTDGKATGKAKCNPAEQYKSEVGLKLAVERYYIAKKVHVEGSTLKFLTLLGKEMK